MSGEKDEKIPIMMEEILEQPEVISELIKKHIDIVNDEVEFPEFKKIRTIQNINRITFLGCGSSFYSTMLGNYIFEEFIGLPCECEVADEFINRKVVVEYRTAVVVLSQSGETTDVITAAKKAKTKGALVVAITNTPNSSLTKIVDVVINTQAGKEKSLAATKSLTAQLVVLIVLAIFFASQRKMSPLTRKIIIQELKMLPDKIRRILKLNLDIANLAKKFKNVKNLIVLGSGFNYPAALEGAHKIKEVTYIQAEGQAAEEFKHGPQAIINKGFPIIYIIPKDKNYINNLKELKSLKRMGADILAITTRGNKKLKNLIHDIIFIPEAMEAMTPILSIIPLQLLSYYIAMEKGIDISQLRNLKKFISK